MGFKTSFKVKDGKKFKYLYKYTDEKGETEIKIPKGIRVIGRIDFTLEGGAFYRCKNILRVEAPEGLEEIEEFAFLNCAGLREVMLPKSLRKIEHNAFCECRLGYVFCGSDSLYMGHNCFGESEDLVLELPSIPLADIQSQYKLPALRGFARAYLEGRAYSDGEGYLKSIKRQRKKLTHEPEIAAVMLKESLIPKSEAAFWAEEIGNMGNPELSALFLEYRNKNA